MTSFPVVGTVGRGVFSLTISGEAFRGVVRFHRVGTLESTQAYFAEVLDKNDFADAAEWPDAPWWNTTFDAVPAVAKNAKFFDERGRQVESLPAEARIPSLATDGDYYGRILPLLRKLES